LGKEARNSFFDFSYEGLNSSLEYLEKYYSIEFVGVLKRMLLKDNYISYKEDFKKLKRSLFEESNEEVIKGL
jgi:hypothetical protein